MVDENNYDVIQVNYWREMRKDLDKMLESYWETMLLIQDSVNFEETISFLKKLPPTKRKVVYISLTKTCDALRKYLDDFGEEVFIIDCVSSFLFEKKKTKGCVFVKPPSNLEQMTKLITNAVKKIGPGYIFLDSLSQFIDFSSSSKKTENFKDLYEFLKYMKFISSRTSCKFVLMYDDKLSRDLVKLPKFHVDIILKLEAIVDRIGWID